jgi:argininosuccinate lyase
MQEDKEALFDTVDTLRGSLRVMTTVLGNLRINAERTRAAASVGFLNATDLADYLVRKGLAFRIAHELVGRVVNHAMGKGVALEEVALEEYRQFSPLFAEDVYDALKLETSLANKPALGGTSPTRVKEALEKAKASLPSRSLKD